MLDRAEVQVFEEVRPTLLGLAYRILGSLADAEDAVQDTYLKWAKSDRQAIDSANNDFLRRAKPLRRKEPEHEP